MRQKFFPAHFLVFTLILALVLPGLTGCKKYAYFAPADALLQLSADKVSIQLNESVKITILGYHADGSPLWDDTRIDLTIENGSPDADFAELKDGRATFMVTADMQRGQMKITARSGSVQANPNPLIIDVGQTAAVTRLMAALNPAVLPYTGGQSHITVTAYDAQLQPVADAPVILETNAGTLNSNGTTLYTNANGQVTDHLQTTTEAEITIHSGDLSHTVTISLETAPEPNQTPTADFSFSPSDPVSGETIYFNASASNDPDGYIQSYSWDFGDGSSAKGQKPTHTYTLSQNTQKSFTVTLTVYDDQDAHHAVSRTVTVTPTQQ